MEETNANSPAAPDSLPDKYNPALPALAWGLFWRMIFAQAAPLFLVAAAVCFFAFNWADMPAFAKFGLIGALMLGSVALALWRGIESTAGGLGLLACGLFAGPLLAVFGQTYQTGADPWELFRAWTLFLLPLALVGRQNGLWFALWVTASLWAGLYLNELADFSAYWERSHYPLYLALMQTAALFLREGASLLLSGPGRPFLRARWFPRVMAFPLMTFLTCMTAAHIVAPGELNFGSGYLGLLALLIICGGVHYTQKQRDPLMIAYGLMSLITLAATLPFADMSLRSDHFLIGRLLLVVLILLGGAAASVKILVSLYRRTARPHAAPESDAAGGDVAPASSPAPDVGAIASAPGKSFVSFSLTSAYAPQLARFALRGTLPLPAGASHPDEDKRGHSPWIAKLLAGVCAWIAVPFLMSVIGLFLAGGLDANGYICLLVLVMAAGAGMSRLEGGIFKSQTALCLALTGTLGAGGLFAFEHPSAFPYVLLLILFAVGYPAVNNALYRFFAAAVGFPVLALTVLADPHGNFLRSAYSYSSQSELPLTHPVIPAIFFALLCAALAHLKTSAPAGQNNGKFDGSYWRPLFAGWITAVLLMGAATLARFFPTFWMIGLGAGVGLTYFSFRLSGQLGLPLFSRVALIGLSAAVAAVSPRLPWFGAGLFALAMARQMGSLPFAGLAIIHLAVCANLEYYNLGTTLLHKSLSLAVIGLLLLAAAFLLHGLLRSAIRQGRLPDPLSLLAGRTQSPSVKDAGTTPDSAGETPSSGRIRIPRKGIVAACVLAFFLLFSWSVLQKERLLAAGDSVILALRPVDPRSLMQGDYMILRFALEDDIREIIRNNSSDGSSNERAWARGTAVVAADADSVFRLKRLDDGSPLATGEKRLVFRSGEYAVQVGSGAFFFQEGHGRVYEKARFALLRVDESGNCLISRLLDEQKNVIQPAKDPEEKPEE